jgi:hypothetical protein
MSLDELREQSLTLIRCETLLVQAAELLQQLQRANANASRDEFMRTMRQASLIGWPAQGPCRRRTRVGRGLAGTRLPPAANPAVQPRNAFPAGQESKHPGRNFLRCVRSQQRTGVGEAAAPTARG